MFESWPQEVKDRIEKEGSLNKFVSAFVSMAIEALENEESDQLTNSDNIKNLKEIKRSVVLEPVFTKDTSK